MDKIAARKLVKDTFERPFDKPKFTYFAKNLFQSLDQSRPFTYSGNTVPKAYQDYINSLERIGQFVDSDEKKIDTLIVRLKKETSLERARTMQRNFIAWYLNGSRDYKDAAVVAFLSPDEDEWRFSLVKMEYSLDDTGKPIPELTPARRWSFLVGAQENSHTAQSQLEKVLENEEGLTLGRLEDAFNVEVVTKEFFTKYHELFNNVDEALNKVNKQNLKARDDFEAKGIDPVNFAKKLLGQIVFLYFLQKKGWFGVGRDEDWGTGPKDFLRRLFENKIVPYGNFFNEVLEPLFYEALAAERNDDFYSRFNCKIPFLNGGLFDPINNYDWVHTDILLPNELFSNQEGTKEGDIGTGILDVFDRYNFTVKEDEPLDKEVAVDPEMLGKVFENLLEVKDRKSKGTYYTPREIVHYMCQESLINYLDTVLNTGEVAIVNERPTNLKLFGAPAFQQQALKTPGYTNRVPREDVEAFVHVGDMAIQHDLTALQNQDKIEQGIQKTTKYQLKLKSIQENASLIDSALANIRVCDPAIGSGAFPVGLMAEIVRARNTLTTYLPDKAGRSYYNFKRHAIQNCLYGVDIDPGAVEIAKLRLWLSLVVDEDDIKQIQPLPNLDYKIVGGNSLLGVERRIENWPLYSELERLKPLHFAETNAKKKLEYKRQIDQLIIQLTDNKKTFDFEVYFSEVFHEKGGFDIVIANPPYVGERKNKGIFTPIQQGKLRKYYLGRMDYFYFFFHLAIDICGQTGVIAFITTNYYPTALGARKLRKDINSRCSVLKLINLNELKLFESASGQHNLISILRKGKDMDRVAGTCITKCSGVASSSVLTAILSGQDITTEYYDIRQEQLWEGDETYLRVTGSVTFGSDPLQAVLSRMVMGSNKTVLGDLCHTLIGLESSLDDVYIVNEEDVARIAHNEKERMCFRPFYKNSDIEKYTAASEPSRYILYLHEGIPNIQALSGIWQYLTMNQKRISARKGANLRGAYRRGHWWVLNTPRIDMDFDGEKIVTPYRTKQSRFAYNSIPWYASRDVYYITKKDPNIDLKYIIALLNSRLYFLWMYNKGKRKGEMMEMYSKPMSEIPIKRISNSEQEPFIHQVDKIIEAKKHDHHANISLWEQQIDQLVYQLYGLTSEEITVVEGAK